MRSSRSELKAIIRSSNPVSKFMISLHMLRHTSSLSSLSNGCSPRYSSFYRLYELNANSKALLLYASFNFQLFIMLATLNEAQSIYYIKLIYLS